MRAGEAPVGRGWMRSVAIVPGAVLSLLPSATCPACVAAYAGALSAVGLGFLFNERVLAPVIAGFLLVGVASIAWSARSHRRVGPLIATILGSAAVVVGRLLWSVPAVLDGGAALLIGASLWNLWIKRPRREALVRLRLERTGECPLPSSGVAGIELGQGRVGR